MAFWVVNLILIVAWYINPKQGRSQFEANRGTCLSHLRFDPSVSFKRSHHKDPE